MTASQRKQVLVVEDDESMAVFVTHVLTRSSLDVTHVTSAEMALESFRSQSWDCMIADIGLPGMSGVALTRRLRAAGHDLAVAVMTAHHQPGMDAEVRDAGADAFLPKPFSPSVLRSHMARLLHGGAPEPRPSDRTEQP